MLWGALVSTDFFIFWSQFVFLSLRLECSCSYGWALIPSAKTPESLVDCWTLFSVSLLGFSSLYHPFRDVFLDNTEFVLLGCLDCKTHRVREGEGNLPHTRRVKVTYYTRRVEVTYHAGVLRYFCFWQRCSPKLVNSKLFLTAPVWPGFLYSTSLF